MIEPALMIPFAIAILGLAGLLYAVFRTWTRH